MSHLFFFWILSSHSKLKQCVKALQKLSSFCCSNSIFARLILFAKSRVSTLFVLIDVLFFCVVLLGLVCLFHNHFCVCVIRSINDVLIYSHSQSIRHFSLSLSLWYWKCAFQVYLLLSLPEFVSKQKE